MRGEMGGRDTRREERGEERWEERWRRRKHGGRREREGGMIACGESVVGHGLGVASRARSTSSALRNDAIPTTLSRLPSSPLTAPTRSGLPPPAGCAAPKTARSAPTSTASPSLPPVELASRKPTWPASQPAAARAARMHACCCGPLGATSDSEWPSWLTPTPLTVLSGRMRPDPPPPPDPSPPPSGRCRWTISITQPSPRT